MSLSMSKINNSINVSKHLNKTIIYILRMLVVYTREEMMIRIKLGLLHINIETHA